MMYAMRVQRLINVYIFKFQFEIIKTIENLHFKFPSTLSKKHIDGTDFG